MWLYRAPLNATIAALPAWSRGKRRKRSHRRCRPARFASRPDPCKTRTRAPAATDVRSCAVVFYCIFCIIFYCPLFIALSALFLIALSALFLAPSFPLYEKRQGYMPWRVAPLPESDTIWRNSCRENFYPPYTKKPCSNGSSTIAARLLGLITR